MIHAFLLALSLNAHSAEVPSYLRDTKGQRDVGAVNENFRALSDNARKIDLTNGGSVDGALTVKSLAFPDGTSQTTAATSEGAIGSSGYSNAMDYSNIKQGVWSVVAYSSFTAAASVAYTNFNSSYTFRANVRLVQNTSNGLISYLPNADTGATHKGYFFAADSAGNVYSSPDSTALCAFASAANLGGYVLAAGGASGRLEISAKPGNTKLVIGNVESSFYDAQSAQMTFRGGCLYTGAADWTTLTFTTSAGTMTGYITWEALWTPQVP